jgi:hypothetical protein
MSADNSEFDRPAPARPPIEQLAESRLKTPPYKVLGDVSCRLDNGQLTLSGHVPSQYHKQLAQTAVSEFVAESDEIREVVNRIEVVQSR